MHPIYHQHEMTAMSQTKKNKKQGTPLAHDFVPGDYDVVCAKGKAVQNHVGESVEVGKFPVKWRCGVYLKHSFSHSMLSLLYRYR